MGENPVDGKTVLVTGGTGSFGNTIINSLLQMDTKKVIIFSRDENKQYHMKNRLEEHLDRLKFVIGDVRDLEKLRQSFKNVDVIYHAAAYKHVPGYESFPMEAVKTNVLGAHNVKMAAIENNVEKVVAISTDKAVKPINVMGMTKALQEKVMLDDTESSTDFICVRYGNVLSSRGSVIPFFKERIKNKKFLPITHQDMTRYLLSLEQAIDLVFHATKHGKSGQLFVRKMPACRIADLASVMGEMFAGDPDYPTKIVGIRQGEKIHELLVSEEEMRRAKETENHYIIHKHGLLEKPEVMTALVEYGSNTFPPLTREEIVNILKIASEEISNVPQETIYHI